MTQPNPQAISPFFIVSNVDQTIAFYRDKLGFETRFQEPDRDPFFAASRLAILTAMFCSSGDPDNGSDGWGARQVSVSV